MLMVKGQPKVAFVVVVVVAAVAVADSVQVVQMKYLLELMHLPIAICIGIVCKVKVCGVNEGVLTLNLFDVNGRCVVGESTVSGSDTPFSGLKQESLSTSATKWKTCSTNC